MIQPRLELSETEAAKKQVMATLLADGSTASTG